MSFLKRMLTKEEKSDAPSMASEVKLPNGVHKLSPSLQRIFSKDVKYNMKIVLKGDRNTGKTCLFNRIQNKPFISDYTQTDEIQVAYIQWCYKSTSDLVKVEFWDVVDKSQKRKKVIDRVATEIATEDFNRQVLGLKLSNATDETSPEKGDGECDIALDSETVNVYNNANGVIMMYDVTRQWTAEYIERHLPQVPAHLPVLILGNKLDEEANRQIPSDRIPFFIRSLRNRDPDSVLHSEICLKVGYGLKLVHLFMNLPFLELQRHSLAQLLQRNANETVTMREEIGFLNEGETYEWYLQCLEAKAAGKEMPLSPMAKQREKSAMATPPDVMAPTPAATSKQPSPSPKLPPPSTASQPPAVKATVSSSKPPDSVKRPVARLPSVEAGESIENFLNDASVASSTSQPHRSHNELTSDDEDNENPLVSGAVVDFTHSHTEQVVTTSDIKRTSDVRPFEPVTQVTVGQIKMEHSSSPRATLISNHFSEPESDDDEFAFLKEHKSDFDDVFDGGNTCIPPPASTAPAKFEHQLSSADLDELGQLSQAASEEKSTKGKKKKKVKEGETKKKAKKTKPRTSSYEFVE